jgi:hypothetical protein
MDKELRYGRVQIVENTVARVHVRWTYQSTDFEYRVWGDSAVEDFYFYPDGMGTRVLTLNRNPKTEYELSEFIVLTPPAAYPLDVLPTEMVDILFLDGDKHTIRFPDFALHEQGRDPAVRQAIAGGKHGYKVYRIRVHEADPSAAIFFNPLDLTLPKFAFGPFYDRGHLVTPAYWGSHWPLSRGKSTGWTIDDRVDISPAHNSLLTWAMGNMPVPHSRAEGEALDTLGNVRRMVREQWVWLIGMNDDPDARLLDWAHSFSRPPGIKLEGGVFDVDSYSAARRAIRIRPERGTISITLNPVAKYINPVFEFIDASSGRITVRVDGRQLPDDRYAWDGKTLWLNADFSRPATLGITFAETSGR